MHRKARETGGEVVMVIRRPGDRVLLVTKGFYPEGVYRLPTGQIEAGESPEAAFEREALEETELSVGQARLLGTIHYTFRSERRRVAYISYVYVTQETRSAPAAVGTEETITGFREVRLDDLHGIAGMLRALPGTWADWGAFRAVAHEFVHRKMCCPNRDSPTRTC